MRSGKRVLRGLQIPLSNALAGACDAFTGRVDGTAGHVASGGDAGLDGF